MRYALTTNEYFNSPDQLAAFAEAYAAFRNSWRHSEPDDDAEDVTGSVSVRVGGEPVESDAPAKTRKPRAKKEAAPVAEAPPAPVAAAPAPVAPPAPISPAPAPVTPAAPAPVQAPASGAAAPITESALRTVLIEMAAACGPAAMTPFIASFGFRTVAELMTVAIGADGQPTETPADVAARMAKVATAAAAKTAEARAAKAAAKAAQ